MKGKQTHRSANSTDEAKHGREASGIAAGSSGWSDSWEPSTGGIAAGLAFAGMAIFGLKKSQKEIVQPETLL